MSKFNKLFSEISNKYHFNQPVINTNNSLKIRNLINENKSYFQLYKYIISENYNIFPVPTLLLNDMLDFTISHKSLDQKVYNLLLINDKLLNWKYYKQFKINIQLMLKKNLNSNITLVLFQNNINLQKILNKYPNQIIQQKVNNNQQIKGCLFDYTENFDLCLAINISNKSRFQLNKIIQHQLIHWMQTVLNSETKKTYGLFDNMKFNLTIPDMFFLNQFIQFQKLINYVVNSIEFEPWVANTNQQFIYSGLTIQEFQQIIKDRKKFVEIMNNQNISIGQKEMYLFAEICYLTSKNNTDDRYWYLIQALKEN